MSFELHEGSYTETLYTVRYTVATGEVYVATETARRSEAESLYEGLKLNEAVTEVKITRRKRLVTLTEEAEYVPASERGAVVLVRPATVDLEARR